MGKNKKKINSIVIASQNPGKIKEMLPFIKKLNTKIYFAKDFKLKEPKEDGSNFVENALKKSRYVNNKTKKVSIADDSGLVIPSLQGKPGIFSSPCSIELYTEIFDQENSLNMLETFASINGPNFYNLPINNNKIRIVNQKWTLDEFTIFNQVKIKNFYGGKELNWKVL